jgi:hypothetical protein
MNHWPITLVLLTLAGCTTQSPRQAKSESYIEIPDIPTIDGSIETQKRRANFDKAPYAGEVSLLQLIATPERYHGKRVIVTGVAMLAFESQWIFPSKDLAAGSKNCIWLEKDFGNRGNDEKDRTLFPVLVEGVFDSGAHGHMGQGSGTLCYIRRFERLKQPNQALLPTSMSVTDRAYARSAPDTFAADL